VKYIIGALITGAVTLAVAAIGYINSPESGQTTSFVQIINIGTKTIIETVTRSKPPEQMGEVLPGQMVTRVLPLNKLTHFDSDVTVSIIENHPLNGVIMLINGKRMDYIKPGAWLEAKRDATKVCFVALVSITEGAPSGGKPSFEIEYFCKSPKWEVQTYEVRTT